jgi:hypothetical protein
MTASKRRDGPLGVREFAFAWRAQIGRQPIVMRIGQLV